MDNRATTGPSRRTFLQSGAALGAGAAIATSAAPALAASPRRAHLIARALRTDARRNPIGTQNPTPVLSWQLIGTAGTQRAFQVRAATSRERLRAGRPDLWNSGRITSSAGSVTYAGRTLHSRDHVFWQVRVWAEHDRAGEWSAVAQFELGLLAPQDWTAQWVGSPGWDAAQAGSPGATVSIPQQHARFVRLAVTKLGLPLQEGWPDPVSRLQLAEVQVLDSTAPSDDLALHAPVTCTDAYPAPGSWEPEYLTDGKTSGTPAPYGFTSLEHHGQDVSATPILVTIDLGTARTFDRVVLWPRTDTLTPDGRTANFPVDFTVQVADSADGPFTVAQTVTDQAAPEPPPLPAALPVFARHFSLRGDVSRARLYITGLGVYSATINGEPVGRAVLEPGNTDFVEHLVYSTTDVTHLLRRGANAIGVAVGTGIYDTQTYSTRYAKFNDRIGAPKLLAQLEITYTNGRQMVVGTDSSWRTSAGGTTFSNWYGGEDFDARRLLPGWDAPDADLSGWAAVSPSSPPAPGTQLVSRRGPAVEIVETMTTKTVTQPKPGVYVFDLGTNVAGWQQLTVRGAAGTAITMRPAELLNADGTVDQSSTGTPIFDTYTLRGGRSETWHPEFMYHGFRYVQVEGLPSAPSKQTITALVLRAANDSAGSFESSDDLLNDIHRIINRATQSNMFWVLTDCPHREKLGWMEEDHLVFDTVCRNYDVAAYGHDIVQAMADAQLDDGMVPDIAPEYTVFSGGFRDDPNWGGAMVLVPWNLYRTYGDRSLLETYYPNMKRYVDYLTTKATGHLLDYGLGDWATINASTPTGVTATFGYFAAADALARAAGALGNSADATSYGALRDAIGEAFHAKYYDATNHTYATGSQCSDALALDMGVAPDGVLDHLVANLRTNGYHLNIGEIGLPSLFTVLAAAGRNDVVYEIATQTTAPSYGAMLARGATSLTEYWDGSGSQNHFMLGAIDRWFTRSLGGIDQVDGSVGYRHLLIAPAIVGDLTEVEAAYRTPQGTVSTRWTRSGRAVRLDLSVPVGAVATVRLPGRADQVVGAGTHRLRTTLP